MSDKKQNGVFYTTNYSTILNFDIPSKFMNLLVIEPFVGSGELIKFALKKGFKNFETYDINLTPIMYGRSICENTDAMPR